MIITCSCICCNLEPLECIHSDPNAWWMGQIMKYLFKFKPFFTKRIENIKKEISFVDPIVG